MRCKLPAIILLSLLPLPSLAGDSSIEKDILARCGKEFLKNYKMDSFAITGGKLLVKETIIDDDDDSSTSFQSSAPLDALVAQVSYTREGHLYLHCKGDAKCFKVVRTKNDLLGWGTTTSEFSVSYQNYGYCGAGYGDELAKRLAQTIRTASDSH